MLSGKTILSNFFCPPLESGLLLKEIGNKLFANRVDTFSEGDWCAVMQTGCHKCCLLGGKI